MTILSLFTEYNHQTYSECPSLAPLITLMKPVVGSEDIFDIAGNSSKPDCFEELASHVEILNVALNDIDSYVLEEKAQGDDYPAFNHYGSPGKAAERPPTELEQVKSLLDRLHGKIGKFLVGLACMRSIDAFFVQRTLVWLTWHDPVRRLGCSSCRSGYTLRARPTRDGPRRSTAVDWRRG